MEQNLLAWVLVGLVCWGMGAAFFVADRAAYTSRALALAFAAMGGGVMATTVYFAGGSQAWWLARLAGLCEMVVILSVLEWVLRVRGTVPAHGLETRSGDTVLRWGQVAGVVYGLAAMTMPEARMTQFLNAAGTGGPASPWFWVFAVPLLIAGLAGVAALLLLLNRKPDEAERRRVVAMALAIPLLGSSLLLPESMAPVALLLGGLVFLIGAVQYHVEQGRRGELMAQFLSPQVVDMVRRRGVHGALEPRRLELSVVMIDLRGFTRVTASNDSADVLRTLAEYYRTVGEVASRYGGTIKDQAGDGVLILVGAPVEDPLHPVHAVEMARALRDACGLRLRDWAARGLDLGVGVGVASGEVTAGVIGQGARMEYTAVGAAVNLAARLCQHAADGEVLVAPQTLQGVTADAAAWQPVPEPLLLKGVEGSVRALRAV